MIIRRPLFSFGTGMLAVSLTDVMRTSDTLPPYVNNTFSTVENMLTQTETEIETVVGGGFKIFGDSVLNDLTSTVYEIEQL